MIYILLGILDVLVLYALIFKLYMFPFREYIKEFGIIAVITSCMSYLLRNELELTAIDPIVQLVLLVLATRYVIKIRYKHAIPLVIIGYLLFVLLQFVVYGVLTGLGFVNPDNAKETTTLGIYTIQIANQLTCLVVAGLLRIFNFGFSYIPRPPHDIYLKDRKPLSASYVAALAGCVVFISSCLAFILHTVNSILILTTVAILAAILLYYLDRKREYSIDRIHIRENRRKDQILK